MGVAIVLVAGAGIADASNGDPLLVGKSNKASGTTKLKSTSIPLALAGPKSKPPLAVNSKKMVPHLNAQYLGGKTATDIQTTTVQLIGHFTSFGGFLKCPAGTHPAGGGVLPDPGTADDTPFVAVSFPHVASNNSLNGWEGVAGDADGTYTGGGFVYADCATGPINTGTLSGQQVERQHAAILARVRAVHNRTAR
jgi:hypothetical protein